MTKFRGDYVPEVEVFGQAMGEMLVAIFSKVGHENIVQSCATCKNWQEGPDIKLEHTGCTKFMQLPPVKVIVNGCPEYDDKCVIPF